MLSPGPVTARRRANTSPTWSASASGRYRALRSRYAFSWATRSSTASSGQRIRSASSSRRAVATSPAIPAPTCTAPVRSTSSANLAAASSPRPPVSAVHPPTRTCAAGGAGQGGGLPVTGVPAIAIAGGGAALLIGGVVAFIVARRRRIVTVA